MTKSVLLIDDEEIVYDILLGYTQNLSADVQVSWEQRPEQGLKRAAEGDWDLVVIDVAFPGDHTRGIKLVAEISGSHSDVKIVALTNFGYEDIRDDCLEAGAEDFVEKWPRRTEMERRLAEHLGTRVATGNTAAFCAAFLGKVLRLVFGEGKLYRPALHAG